MAEPLKVALPLILQKCLVYCHFVHSLLNLKGAFDIFKVIIFVNMIRVLVRQYEKNNPFRDPTSV